ncbi:hypothetical protein ABXJ76_12410 [Methylobacter sp. G7]
MNEEQLENLWLHLVPTLRVGTHTQSQTSLCAQPIARGFKAEQ